MTILQLGHVVDCRRLYRMRLYLGPHTECQYAELLGYVTLQNGHFVFHLSNHNCNFRKSWKISRLVEHVFVTCISRALHLFCASFHILIFFLCSLSVISLTHLTFPRIFLSCQRWRSFSWNCPLLSGSFFRQSLKRRFLSAFERVMVINWNRLVHVYHNL